MKNYPNIHLWLPLKIPAYEVKLGKPLVAPWVFTLSQLTYGTCKFTSKWNHFTLSSLNIVKFQHQKIIYNITHILLRFIFILRTNSLIWKLAEGNTIESWKSIMIYHPLNHLNNYSNVHHFNQFKQKTTRKLHKLNNKSKEENYKYWKTSFYHSHNRITIVMWSQ